jgi:uncharacterized protein YbjQ (UPF0145 family)
MTSAKNYRKSTTLTISIACSLATAIGAGGLSAVQAQQPSYQPLPDPGAAQLLPALPTGSNSGIAPPSRQPIGDTAAAVPAIIATTTNGIDGYHVRRYLGVVRGIKVFQPTIGQNLRAGLKGIIGGNISSYSEMIEKARQEAYEQLLARSTALGANAVIGLHYDSSSFGLGGSSEMGTEVICYGTAVSLEADH